MTKFVMLLTALLSGLPCFAFDQPKVVVMEGLHDFAPHLRGAAEELKLNVEFHATHTAPHFTVNLAPKFDSIAAQVMYRKVTGRPEDSRLELREPASRRVLTAHEFRMGTDESSRRHAARQFVLKLRKELRLPSDMMMEVRE
ncbi:hypothetical protein [uncultured Paludibaculum sp.]|uniref:hypothetical protein n=1 Tax=uncultured Paludibaculum sp. TaxID=1765020 RepID=UPI002AAB2067|nr:hypothetical protein [uncultured Paludibaculum sp.]